jgi:cell division protease FtsH
VTSTGSSGAANDLAGATELATRLVREFGLSPELGPVGYAEAAPQYLGQGGGGRTYSEATQRIIDAEVSRLLREAEQRSVGLLAAHRREVDRLVGLLLEHETIDGAEVYAVVGRPMPSTDRSAGPPAQAAASRAPTE